MWKLEEKQVGQVIEKYSLFRTLLLGSGERLKVFCFQSFILKKIRGRNVSDLKEHVVQTEACTSQK